MGSNPFILLVEGHSAGRDSLVSALQKANYNAAVVHTGNDAIKWLDDRMPDLILFDASSMRSNGVRTCQRLRKLALKTPIIHCRAKGEEEDRSAGADVYLERPFSARKVLNRVRALLPADIAKEEVVRYGDITLFRSKRSVEVTGKGEFTLTPKLALLLETFIRHPNEVLSRRDLMVAVWDTDFIGDTRTLDVHVRWVRECIEKEPSHPQLLKTVRGKGYQLIIPDSSPSIDGFSNSHK
jgi:DNA-binding response OmpR family regulator